jgi:hypothetical protein
MNISKIKLTLLAKGFHVVPLRKCMSQDMPEGPTVHIISSFLMQCVTSKNTRIHLGSQSLLCRSLLCLVTDRDSFVCDWSFCGFTNTKLELGLASLVMVTHVCNWTHSRLFHVEGPSVGCHHLGFSPAVGFHRMGHSSVVFHPECSFFLQSCQTVSHP